MAYSALLFLNFLAVFVIMAFLYWKILKEIKSIKERVGKARPSNSQKKLPFIVCTFSS